MKIKLISIILILSCLISVSGYAELAEQEEIVEFSNEEITERHIQEHPYIAKVKYEIRKVLKEIEQLCVLVLMFYGYYYQIRQLRRRHN